jgi:hypothetical protein
MAFIQGDKESRIGVEPVRCNSAPTLVEASAGH